MALLDAVSLRRSAATALRPSKREMTHKEADRVCDEPACATKLSRYNPATSCTIHEGWSDPAPRRRGPRS
jgi:hypothetical protein